MKKVIILTSGGLDSFVSLHMYKDSEYDIYPMYFDFGQNTNKIEIEHAQKQLKFLGLRSLMVMPLNDYVPLIKDSWADTNDLSEMKEDVSKLFLPGRNILFLLYAAIYGYNKGISDIVISSIATDISGDGSIEFLNSIETAFRHGFGTTIHGDYHMTIQRPLKFHGKVDVVNYALDCELDLDLAWSCYGAGPEPCKECPSCKSRINSIKYG